VPFCFYRHPASVPCGVVFGFVPKSRSAHDARSRSVAPVAAAVLFANLLTSPFPYASVARPGDATSA